MAIPITSWLRAFFALQQSAMDGRGFVEIPNGDDEPLRFPRTTGNDVLAIAAALDPFIRQQPLRFGGHGVGQQWRACVDDLERLASHAEYAENRAFWHALPAVCVYLHSQRSPMPPPAVWDALLAQLAGDPNHFTARPPRHQGTNV
jgi:hypothetical protein